MDRLHQIAQLLVSCWRLSGTSEERRIPTSHGVLDLALMYASESGAVPQWAREALHFADSRTGLQCIELRAILDRAQEADLTDAPNPSYQFTEIKVSDWAARRLLDRLGVPESEGRRLGEVLHEAVKRAEDEASAFTGAASGAA